MNQITACTMDCPDACSLLITRKGDGRLNLRGNPAHPFTAGFTCKKIRRHLDRLQDPQRITTPLLRKGNSWQPIGWDAALDLCAAKIQEYRHQPASMVHVQASGAKGVTKEAVKLFFAKLGSSRVRGSLCDAAGIMAYHYDFGSRRNHRIEDIYNARRIVNWGKDLSRSSIHLAAMVKKARQGGTAVLTISPGGDGSSAFSDHQVSIRPGTDRFLAAAVLHRLMAESRIDRRIIAHTDHWQPFAELIGSRQEEELAAVCDVSRADVARVWQYYTDSGPTATLVGAGLQRYRYGGQNIRFINALALLSGQIGRRGGGSYFHLHSLGLFNRQWTHTPEHIKRRSLQMATIGRDILTARDPQVKMMWINGINVVNQAPDSHQIAQAFAQVEFKVVVDAFFNDTALRADLILPTALMLEQEDIIGSFLHDSIQYVPKILEPPGQVRSDHWIVSKLAGRLDPPVDLPSADACMQASLQAPDVDISLRQLRQRGFYQVQQPQVAYAGLRFDHPNGKARLPIRLHEEPRAPEGFPLKLLTLVRKEAIHSQMLPQEQQSPPRVWVSDQNPLAEQADEGRTVFLVSPLGRLQVRLEVMPGLHPEVVVYRRGDWMSLGGGANQLIDARSTDLGGGAAFYDQYVRIEF